MTTNDPKHKGSVEKAHERAQADVNTDAEVNGAGFAQMEAERKDSSQVQAQARKAGEAKSAAEEHSEPKARANVEQVAQGGSGQSADPHPNEAKRQEHERLQPQEKSGQAGDKQTANEKQIDKAYQYSDTEQRMDAMASTATTKTPEARENEADGTENISAEGAYGDPDEVDEIAGPPMPSKSGDMVEKEKA